MAYSGNTGITRLRKAAVFSWQGFRAAYRHEEAFRQEVWLAIVLIPAAFWVGDSALERIVLIVSVLLLMLTEILNSAIEAVVDRFGGEQHELSGRAKDMGSSAVFIAMVIVAVCWGFILVSP